MQAALDKLPALVAAVQALIGTVKKPAAYATPADQHGAGLSRLPRLGSFVVP